MTIYANGFRDNAKDFRISFYYDILEVAVDLCEENVHTKMVESKRKDTIKREY
ncbi:unnamed protein product [marine sediment metagenome]|uniref:Uncharacterized protein n=1 Tax=marine sediment metagenome TaxID=412755 RepID=X1FKD6_9ZZZZ